MRFILLVIALFMSASIVSAACVDSPLFSPSISGSISLPELIASTVSGSAITIGMNPSSDIDSYTVQSVTASSDIGVSVRLTLERRGDSYITTPRFSVDSSVTIDDLRSASFDFEADIRYNLTSGERDRVSICLGSIDADVRGSIDSVTDMVEDVISDLEDIDSIFDVIDVILQVAQIATTYECNEATARSDALDSIFSNNCVVWSDEISLVLFDDVDSMTACGGDARCIANMTGVGGGANCPALYERLLEAESNASAVCSRNECQPVVSLDSHRSSYVDPLGSSRCDGADLNDEACREEFVRVQSPYCPSVDVLELAEAGARDPLTLSLSDICLDEAADEVEVLKDPSGNIISSVECMCLPAMQGYVRQVERMYSYANECLFDNSSRDCKNASYRFVCDLAVGSALQCGGLGLHEFSGSTRTFLDASGNPIDFANPQDAADAIADGGVFVFEASGGVDFDATRLAHDICESALGDASIDWSRYLDPESVSLSTNTLCAQGVELTSSCVCDLSASGPAQMCGTNAMESICTFNTDEGTAECGVFDSGDSDQQEYEEAQRRMQNQWQRNLADWQDSIRSITSLPQGRHGSASRIISCTEYGGFVEVKQRSSSGDERVVLLKNSYISMPDVGSGGYIARRSFSCSGSDLEITITPTPFLP